jgi:hypothetical protein
MDYKDLEKLKKEYEEKFGKNVSLTIKASYILVNLVEEEGTITIAPGQEEGYAYFEETLDISKHLVPYPFDGVDEVFSLDEMPKLPKFKTRKERLRFISWCYRILKKVNKGLI